ncbi:S-layer homology domain-containing protein [Candidatus Peregrinibacteria bacterium]|nr:S-layer homology domain-containing protein [Candidatus Peregrinibacteria bacterium]
MRFKARPLILGALIFTCLLSLGTNISAAKEKTKGSFNNIMFSDVDKSHKNFDAIYFLYNTNIIEGYKGEKAKEYKPDNTINRAEFLKLLMEGTKKATHEKYAKCFPDVADNEWYATYICQAKNEGVINGYPDGKFKPEQTITEVEALKILGKLEDWKISKNQEEEWYKPYLNFANSSEIVPTENAISSQMTRGDIAEMIFRNTEIKEFGVDKFQKKLVDELFYNADVPYGGPMGPGGIFGPGGPFGETGAFDNSAYFAGKSGQVKMLDEDFYKNKFCYYSDKGDFQDDVQSILDFISGGKIENIKLAGYDLDGFGVMYCYNGIAQTDLQLFTKDLRDQYNVQCWFDPMTALSTTPTIGYERILCYAPPEKPTWLSEDNYCTETTDENGQLCSTCYKDVISKEIISHQCSEKEKPKQAKDLEAGKDLYIEIKGTDEITAGDKATNLEFSLTDNEGYPIKNRNLKMMATTGIDYSKEITVKEIGDGIYRPNFEPKLAGLYILTVMDDASGTKNDATFRVNPGHFDHIQIFDKIEPYQSYTPNKAAVKVASKDKYDNTIPYSPVDNNLTAMISLGKVDVSHYNDIFYFEVEADDWGMAELRIRYRDAIVGDKIDFNFYPIQIDMPKGIALADGKIEAPISIYFPKKYGKIGSYDFKIKNNLKGLKFNNMIDFDDKDNVIMPLFDVQKDFIHVWQPKTGLNSETPEILPIGTALFDVTSVGSGPIYAADAVLKDTEGQTKSTSAHFTNDASGEISGFGDGIWGGTHVVKPTKDICLEAFVLPLPPGAGAAAGAPMVAVTPSATEAEIEADVAQTNAIFKAIAQSCNCNFYLNITLKKPVTNLSYAEVDAFDANHNGIIESDGNNADGHADDVDRMRTNHPPADPKCIPIYYVPSVHLRGTTLMGLSQNGGTNAVVIDNGVDGDGRTLGHELAHQLSQGEVDDPGSPDSHAEGADQAGNLMNYDHTGDNLTPLQCSEIEKKLP